MLRKTKKAAQLICTIEVSGFAAVMLALVAMFALQPLATWPRMASAVPVDLALVNKPVAMPGALREDALFVAIQMDGQIWFDEYRLSTSAELTPRIRERLRKDAERKLYFKVHARAKYANVLDALHAVRAAGVEDIAFLVDQKSLDQKPRVLLP